MTAKSQRLASEIEFSWIDPAELFPNSYNPNVLDDDLFAKAVASIQTYGFVDPVTARIVEGRYEIIDGEHRVRAAMELGLVSIPVIRIEVDDDTARQLTLVLNELHGRPDPAKLQRLLSGLSERHPIESLMKTLPYAREQFVAMQAPPSMSQPPSLQDQTATRWVERMYRLPRTAADVLDAALSQAKQFEEVTEDWRAMEAIARRYIDAG